MNAIDILIVFVFFILLIFAIYMIIYFYVCDGQTCKAFEKSNQFPPNSKEQALSLLNETGNDGIWPFALIGSFIITALDFWLLDQKFTVKAFTIAFLVGFIVIYCLFSFYAHHYIKPIDKKVAEIIASLEPPVSIDENNLPFVEGTPNERISRIKHILQS